MELERALAQAQRQKSGFVRAEAGFHAELLPTWGGNAKDILDQPKCWSSRAVTQELRSTKKARRLRICTGPRHDEANADRCSNNNPKRAGGVSSTRLPAPAMTGEGGMGTSGGEGAGAGAGAGAMLGTLVRGDESRARSASCALQRVERRCEEIRGIPGQYEALLQKIARVRKEQHRPLPYGRSLVVENKWLCDDRDACVAHWRDIADLKARVDTAQSKHDKVSLLALWPSPPSENHSRHKRDAKIASRAAEAAERIADARSRRAQIDRDREHELVYLTRRREAIADLKRRVERATRLREALCKLVVVAKASTALSDRLSTIQASNVERRRMMLAAAVIQRRWKDTKAAEMGAQYRNAVRVMRKFFSKSVAIRRKRKLQTAANMIYWFLSAYENANFQMVMRNYRYRVVNCQRYFRSYAEITRSRLRALTMLWDRVEREKMKAERSRAITAVRKARAKDALGSPSSSSLFGGGGGDAADACGRAPSGRKDASIPMLSRLRTAKSRISRGNGTETSLLSSLVPQLTEQASTRSALGNGSAAALAAAVDLGMHVPRKVPKDIRRKLIKEHLDSARALFKEKWKKFCRSRNNVAAEARLVTVEDVRSAVQATSPSALNSMFTRASDTGPGDKQQPPVFKLFTSTTEWAMLDLIERGRAIADDRFLDVLNEEP